MRYIPLSGLFVLSFCAAASAADVTITTAQGEVTLPEQPEKVAILDVAAIDSLHALGVLPAGRPDNILVDYLDDVAKVAQPVGTLFEPNLEALATLEPDLIVVGGRSATQLDAVSQVATAIDMTIGADLVSDAKAHIAAYGELFGKQDKAAELVATLDQKLTEAREAGEGKGTALMVLTNGPKMSAFGKGSRFGWVFDATGLQEAATGLKTDTHGNAISHEFIAQHDPDWLIVLDRGAAVGQDGTSAEVTLKNPLVESTKAWKNGNVVYLNPGSTYISGGGYTSLIGNLDILTGALNASDS
ncbi:siderophore ABC transporter substrate-binding protein [Paracoccus onubensis]|uniref:Siderophore ABC transporter substrate-binding protein n=1 Tax=Paracoccus onubensis TaxID=1675788 RepID=A0A418T8L2_9RHOB|nr:siderophore ABC transporter substrate-binding protein [Paracoccus onubensis]RJE89466.1 siderophore ABC transporter substrate-binding protein [Paracoccus onubensis]